MIISINANTMKTKEQMKMNTSNEQNETEFMLSLLIHASYIDNISIKKTARRISKIFSNMNINNIRDISNKIYTALKSIRDNKLLSYAYEVMYYVNNFIKISKFAEYKRSQFRSFRNENTFTTKYTSERYNNNSTYDNTKYLMTNSNDESQTIIHDKPNSTISKIENDIDESGMIKFKKPIIPMNNNAMSLFSKLNSSKKKK